MFAPAKTPKAVLDRLNREMNSVLADKAVQKGIEDQGAEVESGTPEQLKSLVQNEVARWKGVVPLQRSSPSKPEHFLKASP